MCGGAVVSASTINGDGMSTTATATSAATASATASASATATQAEVVQADVETVQPVVQQKRGGGLPPGAIAGIVLGVLIFLLLLGAGAFFLHRRRRQPSPLESEPKDWRSLSSSSSARTTPSPTPFPPPGPNESVPVPESQARAFDFAFDVEATAGVQISPVIAGQEYVRPVSVRPEGSDEWSPVSPVSPVEFPPARPVVGERQQAGSGGYGQGVVSLPQLPRQSMLTRADSVEWRREVEEAANRAATRVGLKVSEPILEPAAVATPETSRWTRRVSGGLLLKGRSASGSGR